MPLCGTKKSRQQKRDPSPSYGDRERGTEANLQLKKEADDLRDKVKRLNTDLDRVRADREKLNTDLDRVRADREKGLSEVDRLNDKIKQLTEDLEAAQAAAKSKGDNDKGRDVDAMIEKYEKKIQVITEQVEAEKKHRESTDNEKQKIEKEAKEAKKHLDVEKTRRVKAEDDIARILNEKANIEKELTATKTDLDTVKKETAKIQTSEPPSTEWRSKAEQAEAELKKEREQRQQKEDSISSLSSDYESLKVELDILKMANEESASHMKKNMENAEQGYRAELYQLETTVTDLQGSLKLESDAKEKALIRLSAATASALLDGNPNVSDLSDPNRPEKLREYMSEIYDDQYTDVYDEFEKSGKSEEEIIRIMSDLLLDIYNHCKESAEDQLTRVEEDMFLPPMETPPSPGTNGTEPVKSPTKPHPVSKIPRFGSHKSRPGLFTSAEKKDQADGTEQPKETKVKRSRTGPRMKGDTVLEVPKEVRKGIKEYRKRVAKQVIPVVEKEITNKLRAKPDVGDHMVDICKHYISKCVELCWYMRIQDPPTALSWAVPIDRTFDVDRYKAYTKNGSHVDYVVWPTMLLYEGGSIAGKGIAQGTNL